MGVVVAIRAWTVVWEEVRLGTSESGGGDTDADLAVAHLPLAGRTSSLVQSRLSNGTKRCAVPIERAGRDTGTDSRRAPGV